MVKREVAEGGGEGGGGGITKAWIANWIFKSSGFGKKGKPIRLLDQCSVLPLSSMQYYKNILNKAAELLNCLLPFYSTHRHFSSIFNFS